MKRLAMISLLWLLLPCSTFAGDDARPAVGEQIGRAWDEVGREFRDLFGHWRQYFSTSQEERPLISTMLRHRDRLGLSPDQVKNLEQLRTDFEKASIRYDADLRIAEMDLKTLLEAPAVDLNKVEAKVREIERTRADFRLARIRAIEKGKEQLSAEQRKKLQELLGESRLTRLQPRLER
ncbi:MAG TPA: periplasmic heavy metal sensor [Candidatus Binatia bacterium]|nr:periplasmic heavy metal sensor [Candidatus Binatia bacterium]